MNIESVDFFYLSMPEVLDIGDGSQDALLVRIQAGDYVGWGECEASPLTSIASYVCPMSSSGCKPVAASVEGQAIDTVEDIYRIGASVKENSFDLLQADHTLSGIDIALWDLLGKRLCEPVFRLLGYEYSYAKVPYASQLFGETPEETLQKARASLEAGFTAVKFAWGPFGKQDAAADADLLHAAREGLGPDVRFMVDAGTVWGWDVDEAAKRLPSLKECHVYWLEEPFAASAYKEYHRLAGMEPRVPLAGGEGAHNLDTALQVIDYAGVDFIQIDTGRIGGISVAKRVADYAKKTGVIYVNHTFTSHLALSASLQPFAGLKGAEICEYPVELKPLASAMTKNHLLRDDNGEVTVPDAPGLGMEVDIEALKPYIVDVEIRVKGEVLYRTPRLR